MTTVSGALPGASAPVPGMPSNGLEGFTLAVPAGAGTAPALIINAAMIPGWPLPGFARPGIANPASPPRRMSETEWLEHLAAAGLNPALLEALRQLRAKPAPKRRLLRYFALLLAAMATLLETLQAELADEAADGRADGLADDGADEAARRQFAG